MLHIHQQVLLFYFFIYFPSFFSSCYYVKCIVTDIDRLDSTFEMAINSESSSHELKKSSSSKNSRIKRPLMLKRLTLPTKKLFQNKFVSVAHLFYFPVLKILADKIRLDPRIVTHLLSTNKEDVSEVNSLLAGKVLLALSVFVRCSVNSPIQRYN